MKILWCCNVVLPEIADAAGVSDKVHSIGWVEGYLEGLKRIDEVKLGIICPHSSELAGSVDNVRYWL